MIVSACKRKTGKEELRAKLKALSWARRRFEKLQEENERLTYQHQLVTEMCKGFDWFRHRHLHVRLADPELMLGVTASEQLTPGDMQQQVTDFLATESEVKLLQQLSSLPVPQQNTNIGSAALPASASHSGHYSNRAPPACSSQLVAPPGDALWLLKQALQLPWPQECASAGDLSVAALIEDFKTTAHSLSLYLVQYEACEDAVEQAEPLRNIQSTLLLHIRGTLEVCSCRRGIHVLTSMQLTNCDTGEQLSEPDTERIGWVTERLQLSQQQQHNIAQGMLLARKLLTPLLQELRELQLQQGGECTFPVDGRCDEAAGEAMSPSQPGNARAGAAVGAVNAHASSHTGGAGAAAGTADCCSSAGPAGADAALAKDTADVGQALAYSLARRQSLLQQEQRSDRMRLLMRKESFLRAWFASYLYGQLTWVQLARMHVLSFPFYPMPILFFSAVAAKVAQTQQQRKKQARSESPDMHE